MRVRTSYVLNDCRWRSLGRPLERGNELNCQKTEEPLFVGWVVDSSFTVEPWRIQMKIRTIAVATAVVLLSGIAVAQASNWSTWEADDVENSAEVSVNAEEEDSYARDPIASDADYESYGSPRSSTDYGIEASHRESYRSEVVRPHIARHHAPRGYVRSAERG